MAHGKPVAQTKDSLVTFLCGLLAGRRSELSIGPYVLSEEIGRGGMGVVYRARHRQRPGSFAVKLLPPERTSEEQVKRFECEAELTQSLRHESTVSVFDFGTTSDGSPYYAME